MSAAATAAGYLYASGRLRGRGSREGEQEQHPKEKEKHSIRRETPQEPQEPREPREVRVAALPQEDKPRRVPTIQYRTRRWKPE